MTVERHEPSTRLAIASDQYEFTPMQVKGLEHMGIEGATEGDLQVFFHQCKVRGLDPFVKQIHMVARTESVRDDNAPDGWGKRVKWTVQTGIDGFRLIARRAARETGDSVSLTAPEWKRRDTGEWVDAWDREWGLPLAARVTISRAGQPFTAVALFDEYAQRGYGGRLTATWNQRPAGQLAKCAEALAWRMAFPEDLSGLYSDEEMEHADNPTPTAPGGGTDPSGVVTVEQVTQQASAGAGGAPDPAATGAGSEPTTPAEQSPEQTITDDQSREIGTLLQQIGVTERAKAVDYLNDCLPDGRTVRARKDLTRVEADGVLLSLRDDVAKQLSEEAGAARDAATGGTGGA